MQRHANSQIATVKCYSQRETLTRGLALELPRVLSPHGRRFRSSLLLLIFLASFLLCCPLLDGRRGRAPDEYLKRRHPGLHRSYALHLHEGSFRQDSLSLQSGIYCPTASLESLPVLRFRFLVLLFTSPIGRQSKAPASPPVQLNFIHS
jgi:hypothetical protein